MSIGRDTQISELNSNSSFYDWFLKENNEIIAKLNLMNTFTVEGTNGITAPIDTNGKATISLSGKVDQGISFNGPAYFNGFVNIPNVAVKVDSINTSRTGFTFGTPVRIYYDINTSSVTYEPCRSTDPDQAEVYGVISQITSSYSYITLLGKIDGDFTEVNDRGIGLTAGWIYFLSGTTGHITDVEPNLVGSVSKPVIMGISGSSGLVLQMRGDYLDDSLAGICGSNSNVVVVTSTQDIRGLTFDNNLSMGIGDSVSIMRLPGPVLDPNSFVTHIDNTFNYPGKRIPHLKLNNTQLGVDGFEYLVLSLSSDHVHGYKKFNANGTSQRVFQNSESGFIVGLLENIVTDGSLFYYYIRTSGPTKVFPNGIKSTKQSGLESNLVYLNPFIDYTNPGGATLVQFIPIPNNTNPGIYKHLVGTVIEENFIIKNRFDSIGLQSPSASVSSSLNSNDQLLVNGNFGVWQRDTGRGLTYTSTGNVIFADMWRRHDGISGPDASKNYYIIRREFDQYESSIEGNPEYYIDIKALGASAVGYTLSGVSYENYNHFMVGHVVPNARKFDNLVLNVKFFAKCSHTNYSSDVYLSRYTGSTLLDYRKISTVDLNTAWTPYTVSIAVPNLEDNGVTIDGTNDYCEIGLDLIPLISEANDNGIGITQNVYVSLANLSASIGNNVSPFSVYPEYEEQLKYCQKFYYESYARNDNDGSVTLLDATTPTQNTISQFIMPNKTCSLFTWPTQMRTTPTVTLYSPATGRANQAYNKTASNSTTLLDTVVTCGTIGYAGAIRECAGANLSTTPTIYGVNVCVNGGVVNYDEVYYHIIADADFTIWGN